VSGHRVSWAESPRHGDTPPEPGAETTAQLVWILAERLPEPEGVVQLNE
jgi:hypothetical protein